MIQIWTNSAAITQWIKGCLSTRLSTLHDRQCVTTADKWLKRFPEANRISHPPGMWRKKFYRGTEFKPLLVTMLLPLRLPPGNRVVWCPLKIWRTAHFFSPTGSTPPPTPPFLCCSCIATEELLPLHSSSCVGGGSATHKEATGSRLNPSRLQLWMGFHWQAPSKLHQ